MLFTFCLKFFLMWTISKVVIEFVTAFPLYYALAFSDMACRTLTPSPVIEPTPAALEGKVKS